MIAELNEKLRVANEKLQNPIVKTKDGATYTQESVIVFLVVQ